MVEQSSSQKAGRQFMEEGRVPDVPEFAWSEAVALWRTAHPSAGAPSDATVLQWLLDARTLLAGWLEASFDEDSGAMFLLPAKTAAYLGIEDG